MGFQAASLERGDKQRYHANQAYAPNGGACGGSVLGVCPNIGDAGEEKQGCPKVDCALRGFTCGVGDDDGGGVKRQHFVAVLLCGVEPCGFACGSGEDFARIVVFGGVHIGGFFGGNGAKQV